MDLHFFGVCYWKFIVFLWWCHASLTFCVPCGLEEIVTSPTLSGLSVVGKGGTRVPAGGMCWDARFAQIPGPVTDPHWAQITCECSSVSLEHGEAMTILFVKAQHFPGHLSPVCWVQCKQSWNGSLWPPVSLWAWGNTPWWSHPGFSQCLKCIVGDYLAFLST